MYYLVKVSTKILSCLLLSRFLTDDAHSGHGYYRQFYQNTRSTEHYKS